MFKSKREREYRFTNMFLAPMQPFMGMLIGFFTMFWGVWVAQPYWAAFERGPQYGLLMSLADEPVWGMLAIIIGAILIRACWTLRAETIRLASLASFYFWSLVAISYMYSDLRHLAMIPALYFAFTSGYAYLNLTMRQKRGLVTENLPYNNKADII